MWPSHGQCSRSAKIKDRCHQHDPAFIAKKKAEATAKYNRSWAARRLEIHGHTFYMALEQIAAGHNNARGLAQKTIDTFKRET
jgi:hypothetical protein